MSNMTPAEVLAGLQEFVPHAQKHPHSRKGYVVGMRRKNRRDELDEVQTYLYAASVRSAVAALIAERDDAIQARDIASAMASDLMRRNAELEKKVNEYRLEYDNPAKDYVRRSLLRDQMFALARAEAGHG